MKSLYKIRVVFLFALVSLLLTACSKSNLRKDEMVVFFPTSATQNNGVWDFQIHSWAFEREEKDLSRILVQNSFKEIFEQIAGLENDGKESITLKQRLMWFLVDNKSNKKLSVTLDNEVKVLNKTASNGHAETKISLNKNVEKAEWLTYRVKDKYQRDFSGEVQLIPQEGLSVISDIDDTIKISNVLDKKELIINTFLKPYAVTDGFPEYYKALKKKGAYFHYVSASPWQLYPSLKPFMDENYPKGTVSLRNFRLKDSSLLAFLEPSTEYKVARIKTIIQRYPKHQFILIGDSGEHDPEIYAEIYKQFSKNIQAIQIRAVEGSDLSDQRFIETFKSVPQERWSVSSKPM